MMSQYCRVDIHECAKPHCNLIGHVHILDIGTTRVCRVVPDPSSPCEAPSVTAGLQYKDMIKVHCGSFRLAPSSRSAN